MNGTNPGETEYWRSARQWVDYQDTLDTLMQPVLDRLLDDAAPRPGQRILDIGCGTGASTLAAACLVGPAGHVTGADISDIMLTRARERTARAGHANIGYIEGDAQTYAFAQAEYDMVISRFGVMFFGDPIAAFQNIATAVKPGGSLVFLAWSGHSGNPWFAIPAQAAIDVLGKPEAADPRAPGPMAFQDRSYVEDILQAAEWRDITTSEISLELTPVGTVAEIAAFATRLGPASRIIKDRNGSDAEALEIEKAVAAALATYERNGTVRVPATLNLVQAHR